MNKRTGIIMLLVTVVTLLAAMACGSSATATPVSQPLLPTAEPIKGNPPPEEPPPVEVLAPIEDATVVSPDSVGGDYVLKITSGLPNGCTEFNGYDLVRNGNRFVVEVNNLVPHPSLNMACTEIYGMHEGQVTLGSDLTPGETYTVTLNEDLIISFNALDADGLAMVEKESPVEEVEVTGSSGSYDLAIVSRLPKGSSCSRFVGYKLNRRFLEYIEVSVTHREVSEDNVPCTRDLPVIVTDIPLGTGFDETMTYTVVVNGQETKFPSEEMTMVETQAPIEDVILVTPERAAGEYAINVTSGLPSGCAKFNEIAMTRNGNAFTVDVTNLMPSPDESIACTAIYGYHESKVALGSGLTAREAYMVTINGDLALSFTAQPDSELAMVEKESPIESVEVTEADDGYLLTVISRLPMGSSCSSFSGYKINRRFFDRVEVTLTHQEVAEASVPCTADLPVVVTEIPLGDSFESGQTYTVSVNGEETSFTAQ